MSPFLTPTCCLDFEPVEVKALHWMPLAVRHKLDEESLKLKLDQWQRLPLRAREDLVISLGEDFVKLASKARASPTSSTVVTAQPLFRAQLALMLGCSIEQAQQWLRDASPFAHYVMVKRSALAQAT